MSEWPTCKYCGCVTMMIEVDRGYCSNFLCKADHLKAVESRLSAAERVLEGMTGMVNETADMCNLICNSSPETEIRGEIETKALSLGHYILQVQNDITEYDKEGRQ